jgi:hypothetical protein
MNPLGSVICNQELCDARKEKIYFKNANNKKPQMIDKIGWNSVWTGVRTRLLTIIVIDTNKIHQRNTNANTHKYVQRVDSRMRSNELEEWKHCCKTNGF